MDSSHFDVTKIPATWMRNISMANFEQQITVQWMGVFVFVFAQENGADELSRGKHLGALCSLYDVPQGY